MSDDQNVWDDALLVKAYDESVTLARETLARRIADATNRREDNVETESDTKTDPGTTSDAGQENVFKVGDFARATYTDGLDYEGTIMSIDEKAANCVVRYVGYENEQDVPLTDLLPSWGSKARREQILYAKRAEVLEAQQQHRSKTNKKSLPKEKQSTGGRMSMGALPGGLVMPPMPLVPPMMNPTGTDGEPEQDFVAMLTAWYMSGYYTGLYQGKKQGNDKKTPRK